MDTTSFLYRSSVWPFPFLWRNFQISSRFAIKSVHAWFFRQGCYIGQESISRVNAYKAVKNGLYGVSFEKPGVPEGAELLAEETGKRWGRWIFEALIFIVQHTRSYQPWQAILKVNLGKLQPTWLKGYTMRIAAVPVPVRWPRVWCISVLVQWARK